MQQNPENSEYPDIPKKDGYLDIHFPSPVKKAFQDVSHNRAISGVDQYAEFTRLKKCLKTSYNKTSYQFSGRTGTFNCQRILLCMSNPV